ncbi:MAG: VanZ family protein [Armatimonadota bacterium]
MPCKDKKYKRFRYSLIAVAWMLVIFLTSCTRVTRGAFVGTIVRSHVAHSERWFDAFWERYWFIFVKGYHVMEFAVLMVLCHRALREYIDHRKAVCLSLLFSIAYAASDEWHQTFTPYRGGRATDVIIDTAGILFAASVIAFIAKRTKSRIENITVCR